MSDHVATLLLAIVLSAAVNLVITYFITIRPLSKQMDNVYESKKHELELFYKERQQLLDRIQAPSFDHLKHHEVKVIKAMKEEPKETVTLEVV